ncbi:MAG: TetR/AcrR family transcriptional regulator [Acidimicrobiia bacterium]
MVKPSNTDGSRSNSAKGRRRDAILQAAVTLLAEKGYVGATTEEIAAAADVTKRTLYRHIGSKQRLLFEIHENFIDAGLQRWQAVADRGLPPAEALEALIHEHVATVAAHRQAISVFFEEMKHLAPDDRAEIVRRRDSYELILFETMETGIRSGDFRDLDARLAALIVLGTLTELYRWYRPEGPLTPDQVSDVLVKTIMRGLRH